jgi:hypothetical protein
MLQSSVIRGSIAREGIASPTPFLLVSLALLTCGIAPEAQIRIPVAFQSRVVAWLLKLSGRAISTSSSFSSR